MNLTVNKRKLYKAIIPIFLMIPFLLYFTSSAIISYSPSIIFIILTILVELIKPTKLNKQQWLGVLAWFPYCFLAFLSYILHPFNSSYITAYSLIIIAIPIITFIFIYLKENLKPQEYHEILYKYLLYFIIGQFLVCIGQISTSIWGIGLPLSERALSVSIITGTASNPNNLAALLVMISYIFSLIEKDVEVKSTYVWSIIFFLVILTASRSALVAVFIIYIFTRNLSLSKSISTFCIITSLYMALSFIISNTSFGFIERISKRVFSIFTSATDGVESDGSMSLRLDSYLHFLDNLSQLGLGTGKLQDYYYYAKDANFSTSLMFENPHSLFVEVGYWLGLPGLLFFLIPFIYLLNYTSNKFLFVFALVSSSLIPSSVLADTTYFIFVVWGLLMNLKIPPTKTMT